MRILWTLAKKDLRLLLRDPRALVILLIMPLLFIFILGISLGEGFGQKPEDRLRVSVVVLDEGVPRFFDRPALVRDAGSLLTLGFGGLNGAVGGLALSEANRPRWFPHSSWSQLVLDDLAQTAGIKIERFESLAEAEDLVRRGRRAAVLVLGKNFSKRVARCSFLSSGWQETFALAGAFPVAGHPIGLAGSLFFDERQTVLPFYLLDGINPFYRDGINLETLDARVLRDPTQQTASAILDQAAQGSLLRVLMPWMIGRAFEKVGDPEFMSALGRSKNLPLEVRFFLQSEAPLLLAKRRQLGVSLQDSLQQMFSRYNLTAKTWAALTREPEHAGLGAETSAYRAEGAGLLKRGSIRYQLLVPSYLVMFAFFMVLTAGWLFTSERRQGTMKRLWAAPLARWQILLGKFIPCYVLSVVQGAFLFSAGRLIFQMSWGAEPWMLVPVVLSTSLAAMGLALVVAVCAQTETQVAIYGTLLVLLLAGLSGGLMGDRSLMPEQMQTMSLATPHAWALDAYRQLLTNPRPDVALVWHAVGVLSAFGAGFLALAWGLLRRGS